MNKPKIPLAWALWSSFLVASCGGGGGTGSPAPAPPPAPAPAAFVIRPIAPSTIDPAAVTPSDTANDLHIVIPPLAGVTSANKLFVFLPGTGGVPNEYELILKAAASRGFHAIGLDYPNPTEVGALCSPANGNSDPNCFWNVRRTIITGDADSPGVLSVTKPNAIVTRLSKALAYLNQQYPGEGWSQYLDAGGAVVWSKVVMSGHSQGGGHAGVMAKLYPLSRACYFASPPDWDLTARPTAPAFWEAYPALTPASQQFGFAGLQDSAVPYAQLSAIWQTLGLGAEASSVQVTSSAAPSGNSHRLTTDLQPNTSTGALGNPSHGLTVRDAFTPLTADGKPVFDAAWGYLCFQ